MLIERCNLSEQDKKALQSIYEPVSVAIPLTNALDGLTVTRDGELRCYGVSDKKRFDAPGVRSYLASRDCGLSWKKYIVENPKAMGKCTYIPELDFYIKLHDINLEDVEPPEVGLTPENNLKKSGIYAAITYGGPDSDDISWNYVSDLRLRNLRHVIYLKKCGRLLALGELHARHNPKNVYSSVAMYSDDKGKTWETIILESPGTYIDPRFDIRWQNHSCEPTIDVSKEGTIHIICRTSTNFHYEYFSYDNGNTWTKPAPSGFHSTLTMPLLYRMNDGRVLFFWCNTQPLPELNHRKQLPPLGEKEISGLCEDVFTNRDANHCAVSRDNGETWKGFREIWLNDVRNASDFRSSGGTVDSLDKSVHQFEAIELPFKKMLLVFGQHSKCRKIVIFDPNWLEETFRKEDFITGLDNVSTHVYTKSISGNFRGRVGHCSWNRTNGAMLMPDPDGTFDEALYLTTTSDDRLLSDKQGVVWNFPADNSGEVHLCLMTLGDNIRISLTDRWFNPIDETTAEDAQISFITDKSILLPDKWCNLTIRWKDSQYQVLSDDKTVISGQFAHDAPFGLSYLIMQSTDNSQPGKGVYIRYMQKNTI